MSVPKLGKGKSGDASTGDDNDSEMMSADRRPKHTSVLDHNEIMFRAWSSLPVEGRKSGRSPNDTKGDLEVMSESQILKGCNPLTCNLDKVLSDEKGDINALSECEFASLVQQHAEWHTTSWKQVAYLREQKLDELRGKSLTADEKAGLEKLEIIQGDELAVLQGIISATEKQCRHFGAELKEAGTIVDELQRSPDKSATEQEELKDVFASMKINQEGREANLEVYKTIDCLSIKQQKLVKELLGREATQASAGQRSRKERVGKRSGH